MEAVQIKTKFEEAFEAGYTQEVLISWAGGMSAVCLVREDADFDDEFRAFDIDNSEWLRFDGWHCDVDTLN